MFFFDFSIEFKEDGILYKGCQERKEETLIRYTKDIDKESQLEI